MMPMREKRVGKRANKGMFSSTALGRNTSETQDQMSSAHNAWYLVDNNNATTIDLMHPSKWLMFGLY